MRRSPLAASFILAAAYSAAPNLAQASPILPVDFQENGAVSPHTESGAQPFDDAQDGHATGFSYGGGYQSNTYSVTGVMSGSITIGLATVTGARLDNQNWNDRDRTT